MIGQGGPQELPASEALAIAARATPASLPAEPGELPRCRIGGRVTVAADDTGRDPVTGTLLAASAEEIVVRHTDPRVGEINLYFPLAGFDICPA